MTRFTNTLLLVMLIILGLSGIIMLYGTWQPWIFELHRWVAFSLVLILPLKGRIIYRSLQRGLKKTFDRSFVIFASLGLLSLLALVLALALLWMMHLGPFSVLLQTLIAWHWIFGLLLILPFLFHLWRRWPRPRASDILSRRDAIKLVGIVAAGLLIEKASGPLAGILSSPESARRFTGSRNMGMFSGNDFPLTGEAAPEPDIDNWRLAVTGAVRSPLSLSYPDILNRSSSSKTETLDCTSGWYSTQYWQGIPLVDLLIEAGVKEEIDGIRLFSMTGYHHTYTIEEARKILLATHVGSEILLPSHGFPLRAIVPGRRGWFWVKWLMRVEVLDNPWEVIFGALSSPREVLRQW